MEARNEHSSGVSCTPKLQWLYHQYSMARASFVSNRFNREKERLCVTRGIRFVILPSPQLHSETSCEDMSGRRGIKWRTRGCDVKFQMDLIQQKRLS